jgi:Electron transfer DM13
MSSRSAARRPLHRRPLVRIAAAAGAVLVVVGLVLFEPWQLVIDQRVDEAAPIAAAPAAPAEPAPPAAPREPAPPAGPVVLARGELISHEHESSGSVVVVELPDGSRVLRLEELNTSNGPDLHVWLSDAPVVEGRDGWGVFDDGRYVDLGDLKGNIGSSNYPLPPAVDLAQLSSVSVWCERFAVSFAAAALEPVTA